MSSYGHQQGQKDAREGKGPADMQNAHRKERQDYNAGYAKQKEKGTK